MKSMTILFLSILTFMTSAKAQKISGTVKALEDGPIEKATVSLLKAKDSSLIKLGATGKDGKYSFEAIPAGSYIVAANSVGYNRSFSAKFDYAGNDFIVPNIELQKASTQLAGVTVTARKPLVEVKADKMIVNVEGTINATGNDGLELLRKSPGVLVDKDDNISMSGKNGVMVYIDGKPSPLKGADLASYLRSMQSSSIEAIELISNPSAKYEAAGNAGIINIRLKKDKSLGTNGTITAGYNIGVLPKYNVGISLNHRNKKVNIFGNYNYNNGKYYNWQSIYRAQADSVFDQQGIMRSGRESHNFKAGLDYFLNTKNTIGVMANGTLSDNSFSNEGPMYISYQPTGVVDRILRTNTNAKGQRNNINYNANYRYFDTSGHELNVDVDYGNYKIDNNQYLPNIYYKADDVTKLQENIYRILSKSSIDLFAVKADYEQHLGKGKIGFGGKFGYVQTKNNAQTNNVIGNIDYVDIYKSNDFNYTENINALYVNYNRTFKGYALQVGLRAENTSSKGRSINDALHFDTTINKGYTDLFPSAALTFNKNPMSQFNITYSRRIDRPAYENLNPFEFKLNDYLYMKGNTELKPQYTNSFGITHTYKYKLTTTLNYSHIKNMFAQIIDTTEKSKAFQTTKNLATQDVIGLNISYPFMYKQFMAFSNLSTNYSYYKADFGQGRVINQGNFGLTYYVQNTLKFGKKKDWAGELTGLYVSPFVWQGMFKGKAMGSVDFGLQKNIMQGKGTLKASVTDIFNTMHFKGDSDYGGAFNRVNANWESRQFKINFTYRFGNAQIKAARQRKTALEDEKNRTSGGSGTPGQ